MSAAIKKVTFGSQSLQVWIEDVEGKPRVTQDGSDLRFPYLSRIFGEKGFLLISYETLSDRNLLPHEGFVIEDDNGALTGCNDLVRLISLGVLENGAIPPQLNRKVEIKTCFGVENLNPGMCLLRCHHAEALYHHLPNLDLHLLHQRAEVMFKHGLGSLEWLTKTSALLLDSTASIAEWDRSDAPAGASGIILTAYLAAMTPEQSDIALSLLRRLTESLKGGVRSTSTIPSTAVNAYFLLALLLYQEEEFEEARAVALDGYRVFNNLRRFLPSADSKQFRTLTELMCSGYCCGLLYSMLLDFYLPASNEISDNIDIPLSSREEYPSREAWNYRDDYKIMFCNSNHANPGGRMAPLPVSLFRVVRARIKDGNDPFGTLSFYAEATTEKGLPEHQPIVPHSDEETPE